MMLSNLHKLFSQKLKLFIIYFILLNLLFSCKKGFTLKIGDQDILAFGSVEDCHFVQNSQNLRVSWKSATPIHFIITSSVPAEFDTAIINAANTWNSLKNTYLIEVHRDNSFKPTASTDGTNGIYFSSTWDASLPKEQGRTNIKWDVSKIKEADIKINAKNFKFFSGNNLNILGKIDFESLILHEFGHALGLKHNEDPSSCMQSHLPAGVKRQKPGDVDINSLKCEY